MEQNDSQKPPVPAKRPVSLTVLCILTFISGGLGILGCLCTPVMAETMIYFTSITPEFKGMLNEQAIMVLRAGWGYYMIMLLLTSVSLTGALMMWNLRKNGFHFYTIANIFIYCLPSFMLDIPFNIIGLVFPGIFISFYALHLRFMK